jgi:hypothetical protein
MIQRTEERMGLKPQRLAADTAYGTGKFLGWLVGAGITPQIPVWDKSAREDGTFSRSDFTFDRERNVYVFNCSFGATVIRSKDPCCFDGSWLFGPLHRADGLNAVVVQPISHRLPNQSADAAVLRQNDAARRALLGLGVLPRGQPDQRNSEAQLY